MIDCMVSLKMVNSSVKAGIRDQCFFMAAVSMLLCFSYADKHYSNMFEPCDEGKCCAGQRLDLKSGTCVPCEAGTYIGICNHSCLDCRPCTAPGPSDNEMVVSNCTSVSDTVIGCLHDHYRVKEDAMSSSCEPCRKCESGTEVIRHCEGGNDTICSSKTTAPSQPDGGAHEHTNKTALSNADAGIQGQSSYVSLVIMIVIVLVTVTFAVAPILIIKFGPKIRSALKFGRIRFIKLDESQDKQIKEQLVQYNIMKSESYL